MLQYRIKSCKYKKNKALVLEKSFINGKEVLFLYQSFVNEKEVIKFLVAFHWYVA